MQWETMETAPKDGKPFIGWDGIDLYYNVYWDHPDYKPKQYRAFCTKEFEYDCTEVVSEVFGLTHWFRITLPLPTKD